MTRDCWEGFLSRRSSEKRRRQKVHGETLRPTHRTALAISALATNYMLAQRTCSKLRKGWSKPPEGKLMINVDASFIGDSGSGSTGVVIRDATGECVAASCSYLPYVTDAAMAEAYALRDGLQLAQQIGTNRFIVQADCMMVVETMKDGGFSASSAAPIFDECYNMWRDFADVSIEHCYRDANRVAHEIARKCLISKQSCIWVNEPPSFLLEFLTKDVTILMNQ